MKIFGVSHPIPSDIALRIYNNGKNVFVGKRCLCKAVKGDKFIIYESRGESAYTGWADIKFIGRMQSSEICRKYGEDLIISKDELEEYSKGRREMFVIDFQNFEKFNKPVKPNHFVTVGGKYIYESEFEMIKKNKD